MRRTLPLLLAALVLVLVAAGCGSDSGSSSSSSSSTAAAPASTGAASTGSGSAVTVDMKNIQFDPKSVTVDVGQTIKWDNLDSVDHNVKADSGADFSSDDFGKGGTFEFKPTKAGKIEYECTLHPGMIGTIEVR